MKDIEKLISPLVQSHFPEFYRDEGPRFIDFVTQYYKWMEQDGQAQGVARSLFSLRDIDKTSDDFLKYFNTKYFKGVPVTTAGSQRLLTKHAVDLYHIKGTERGVQFVIQGVFDKESKVYYPGNDVFKPSHGTWVKPIYLELSTSTRARNYVGKEIIGNTTGAKAFMEGLVRRRIGTKYIDVGYLSNVRGDFQTGEKITESSNTLLEGAPSIIGSLTSMTVVTGGAEFAVGDIFNVESINGKQGLARVTEVSNQTGKVTFEYVDALTSGGWGYTTDAEVIISSKVFQVTGRSNPNTQIQSPNFKQFELVKQYLANVAYDSASNSSLFTPGTVIENYYGNGMVAANAVVVAAGISNSTAGFIIISPRSGSMDMDNTFAIKGNTMTAVMTRYIDRTSVANVVGTNSTHVGVFSITGGNFYATPYANLVGIDSVTSAQIANVSTGTDASFSIGYLTDTESVFLTPDFISSNNTQGVKYAGFAQSNASFNALTGVANTTDVITTASAHGFTNGEYIHYTVSVGNTAVSGLQNGGYYYVQNTATSTSLQLAQTKDGTPINLTAGLSETGHKLTSVYGGAVISSINLNGNNSGAALQYGSPVTLTTGDTAYGGFGFPKFPSCNMDSVLFDVLRFDATTIGSIASLTSINPGNDYNMDPFVAVYEQGVAAYNRYDYVMGITTTEGTFVEGEQIQQSSSAPGVNLTVNTFSGTTANGTPSTTVIKDEYIYQTYANGSIRASGFVVEGALTGGAGSLKLRDVTGTFVLTSNSSTYLRSQTSNGTCNVSAKATTTLTTTARAFVKPGSNSSLLYLKRINLENTFASGLSIVGRTSGAIATVDTFDEDRSLVPIGLNAAIGANVQTANNVVTKLAVQDSGFGYIDKETLTLTKQGSNYQVTAIASLAKQGVGDGFYTSTKGFLDSDKKLHDNDYYQEYSYEVQTKIPYDLYIDVLKQITHVAGTKAFGSVQATSIANAEISVINSIEISS